ncbi:O-antigen ligase family protein [Carboxydocella sp. ULO1]|uniref:O-antigen ligase family protein n=1 Tax=Carboxydocella sp. ULO1 TaxID=1926599 RepID=UPI0009AD149F|nr:O-antigen ligase family protein [Carboxydocella sp. ULO1]GAW29475.1 O-antigen polymerase [Carboxydocella sp. ULO1]
MPVNGFVFWVYILTVFFLVFNRGGFFAFETMPVTAVILALGAAIWLQNQSEGKYFKYMKVLGAIWLVTWFLSLNKAVHLSLAIEEMLRVALYIFSFIIIYFVAQKKSHRKLLLGILLIIGVTEAFSGLGTAYGTFDFDAAYKDGRVMGTMQYPNAYAAFLSMLFILSIFIYTNTEERYLKSLISSANFIMFTGVLSAQSRGSVLVLLMVVSLALVFWPRETRWTAIAQTISTIILAFLFAHWTVDFSGKVSESEHWLALFGGGILGAGVPFIKPPETIKAKFSNQGKLLLFLLMMVLLAGVIYYAFQEEGLFNRLARINWQEQSVQERFVFYQDGLKILKDYPLTGAGGGGWRSLFEKYQSYRYISRETHSYPLKVLVETGIIGFLSYIVFFGAYFLLVLYNFFQKKHFSTLAMGGLWSVLLITLHSFIDFTLSLSAISVIMWTIMALTITEIDEHENKTIRPLWQTISGIIVIVMLFGLAIKTGGGEYYFREAQKALQQNDIDAAKKYIDKATDFNSWKGDYYRLKFNIYLLHAQQQKEIQEFNSAIEAAKKAVDIDSYSPNNVLTYGKALLLEGQIEQGLSELEKLTTLAPYDIRTWEVLTEAYHNVAQYYQQQGETAKAEAYRAKMQEVPRRMEKVWQQVPEKYKRMWIAWPKLEVTDYMKKLLVN